MRPPKNRLKGCHTLPNPFILKVGLDRAPRTLNDAIGPRIAEALVP
jgi:hypothetical protein